MRAGYLASGFAVIMLGIVIAIWAYEESLYIQGRIEVSIFESPNTMAQLEVARVSASLTMLGGEVLAAIGSGILVYGLASKRTNPPKYY